MLCADAFGPSTGTRGRRDDSRARACLFVIACSGSLLVGLPAPATAQWERPPELGGRVASLGQPPRLRWNAGFAAAAWLDHSATDRLVLHGHIGVSRDLMNPVVALANIGLEAYAGVRHANLDGGARAIFRVPYMQMGAGVDYNLRDGTLTPLITGYGPVRRGGILVPGGLLRVDWFPGSRHRFAIGATLPLGDPLAGRGRPIRDYVVVAADFKPRAQYHVNDAALEAVFDSLSTSAEWIRRLVVPFLDHDGRDASVAVRRTEASLRTLQAHLAVRSLDEEVRHFHAQLAHAFTLAAGDQQIGSQLAQVARAILLDEVLLPYNRLLGRKKRKDTLEELATAARGRFSRSVTSSAVTQSEHTERVLFVFQRITLLMDEVRRTASDEWNDARLVWLPLQYALLPEDHDDRRELDALVARATGVSFSQQNRIEYVANLQFHYELLRLIRETRQYHVLWVHDFPAVTSDGALDWASLTQVVDGYLTTLAERVEAYDQTGTLPTYFVFLDEFYYQARRSRILMSILEDPLGVSMQLPRGVDDDAAAELQRALTRLRNAVAQSRVLQAETRQYGDDWLKNRIKVHVSVTNRTDPSFWSGSLIGTIFGYPDNVMRDHRKISFRDVSETDPRRGRAIITGMGVGQQYLGPGWEDRSISMQGPALLELKRAARELLLSQGLPERDLPFALRSASPDTARVAFDATAAARAVLDTSADGDADDFDSAALLLVNGTGYLAKQINVAKTLLYSLMPPGSAIKIPDSLWNSTFFGGLLVGASLRGVAVSIIAPALANAPSDGFPQMARAHELLTRLLLVQRDLGDAIGKAGGALNIGLYALGPDRNSFASRADAWVRQVGSSPFMLTRMPHGVVPIVAAAGATAQATAPLSAAAVAMREPPKLHMKVSYLMTAAQWQAIAHSRDWPLFMATYLQYREATHAIGDAGELHAARTFPAELARLARRVFGDAGNIAHAASYAFAGSQNMDYRGMFMDGEVSVLFSGFASLVPLLDLIFLEGTVTWIADQASLDRLLPPPSELQRRLARVAKDAM